MSPYNHLHAHAMLGPPDKSAAGASFYRRNVIFGALNWWGIEDLRAEIREESSNNRVKSGYEHRHGAPIDRVPDAGSVQVSVFSSPWSRFKTAAVPHSCSRYIYRSVTLIGQR